MNSGSISNSDLNLILNNIHLLTEVSMEVLFHIQRTAAGGFWQLQKLCISPIAADYSIELTKPANIYHTQNYGKDCTDCEA